MPDIIANDREGYIELKFGPRWKYIACVRGFIQNFLAISIVDQTKADKIALAASELLENAVKYASRDDTHILIRVAPATEKISILVENSATPQSITTLREVFQKIIKGDPLQVYVAQMKEAAVRNDGKSYLGLARIRYETGGELTLNITESNVVKLAIDIE
ncbi:MAG: ATP-binding protein [Spirochaetales bacterium]|nr:ATP-binding protein [Spirochaetales bacterium]